MKKLLLLIVALLATHHSLLFSQNLMFQALAAVDDHNYVEAARLYHEAGHRLLAGRDTLSLGEDEFTDFMTTMRSEANCYYMLDDYRQLYVLASRYFKLCNAKAGLSDDAYNTLLSYGYKMWGSYFYGLIDEEKGADIYAEEMYDRALQLTDPYDRDALDVLHQEKAQLYYKQGQYGRALMELSEVRPSPLLATQKAICLARMGQKNSNALDAGQLFADAVDSLDVALKTFRRGTDDYAETLRKKGKVLMMQSDRLSTDNYKEAQKCYEQYVAYQRQTVAGRMSTLTTAQREQNWLALHPFLYDCYRLGNHAPEMLYDLALFSQGYLQAYSKGQSTADVGWKQVRKSLTSTDCALEFVQYWGAGDEKRLGCLVLHHNSKRPLFVDILSTDSLLAVQLADGNTVRDAIESTKGEMKNALYTDTLLFGRLWTPALMQAIGSATRVYFTPDGVLHQLAVEYMMPDTLKTCYRLTSPRLLTQRRPDVRTDCVLLCGGIDYAADIQPTHRGNDAAAYRLLARPDADITQLPGSQKEVDSVLTVRHNSNDTELTDNQATDERFLDRLVKGDYPVVHLSTHGFFNGNLEGGTDLKPMYFDNALSQSGLVFAGASTSLRSESFDADYFDGILSAAELATQDLSSVDLMVLSACQTALGYVTADGVFGLQRGMKLAGVKSMMVTLWSVGDTATYLLMKYFYQELMQQTKTDIHAAFNKARRRLMSEEQEVMAFNPSTLMMERIKVRYDQPQYFNPFVLIDVW